ncbi:stage III sporulation protein AF [Neobacillus sp. SM06]|uniref:stage III sporulation protein AF n=1 Tax=Neobacillus sp. SM06 TaxID=3422492 RepID=UPI003D26ADB1
MSFLIEWVTNIILFILLATVIDMLLPNSSLQKYVKMVVGLLLIAIILAPILKLISSDFETALSSFPSYQNQSDKNIKNDIELKKKEIQAGERAYILEQMAVQLKKDVAEELMKQYGLEITKINLIPDENSQKTFPENLQKVSVLLKQPDSKVNAVEAVAPVIINTNKPLSSTDQTEDSKQIAAFLSNKWKVKETTIEVLIEGGKNKQNG